MENDVSIRARVKELYGQDYAVSATGLGCGNPVALASLRAGEVVVDLGSGAGFDTLNAASTLGEHGRFIGVDMTPNMLERARTNAVNAGHARTVEFREGLIEDLPVASGSSDVVISNCVVNLSPNKAAVFREMFRVLRPGGRIAISDIVMTQVLSPDILRHDSSYRACIAGAITVDAYEAGLRDAGFIDIAVTTQPVGCLLGSAMEDPAIQELVAAIGPERAGEVADTLRSAHIQARKPS